MVSYQHTKWRCCIVDKVRVDWHNAVHRHPSVKTWPIALTDDSVLQCYNATAMPPHEQQLQTRGPLTQAYSTPALLLLKPTGRAAATPPPALPLGRKSSNRSASCSGCKLKQPRRLSQRKDSNPCAATHQRQRTAAAVPCLLLLLLLMPRLSQRLGSQLAAPP